MNSNSNNIVSGINKAGILLKSNQCIVQTSHVEIMVFWNVTTFSLVGALEHFGATCCLIITLEIPESCNLNIDSREILKSHKS